MSKHKVGNIKVKELVKYCETHKYCKTCMLFKNEDCGIGLLANYLDDKIEVKDK